MEKLKKSKASKSSKQAKNSHKNKSDEENEPPAVAYKGDKQTPQGSVISVKEASKEDSHNNVQDKEEKSANSGEVQPGPSGVKQPSPLTDRSPLTQPSKQNAPANTHQAKEKVPASAGSQKLESSQPETTAKQSGMHASASSASLVPFKKNNAVEPVSGETRSQMGSAVSVRSKVAWTDDRGDRSRPGTAGSKSRFSKVTNTIQVTEAGTRNQIDTTTKFQKIDPSEPMFERSDEVMFEKPGEQYAYIPLRYARGCVAKVVEDMKRMKGNHIRIVIEIEKNYRVIEDETQAQFNAFVLSLRRQYGQKVKTFKQVIEVHRAELNHKETYWNESLTSMNDRNKVLLEDKKGLLIQNKVEFDRLEKEKEEAVNDLLQKLDQAHLLLMTTKKEHAEAMKQRDEDSEKERLKFVALIKDKDEEKEKMEKMNEENVNKLNYEHENQLKEKDEEFNKEADRHNEEMKSKEAELQKDKESELQKATTDHEALIEDMKNKQQAEIEDMNKKHQEALEEQAAKYEDEKKILSDQLDSEKLENKKLRALLKKAMKSQQQPAPEQPVVAAVVATETKQQAVPMDNKLLEELQEAKSHNAKLQAIIDELRNKPETSAAVVAAAAAVEKHESKTDDGLLEQLRAEQAEVAKLKALVAELQKKRDEPDGVTPNLARQPTVVVTEISDMERDKMEDERRKMAEERDRINKERKEMDKERDSFSTERKKLSDSKGKVQEDLNNANKDNALLKGKCDAYEDQLKEMAAVKSENEALKAQNEAIVAVVNVNTDEEKKKAEEKIEEAKENKNTLNQEKKETKAELKKWEDNFKKENGKKPTEGDKPPEIVQKEQQLQEVDNKINNMDTKIETLEHLKNGEPPGPPKTVIVPAKIPEPQVKVVEVKIIDPELLAQLEMARVEIDTLKKQITMLRTKMTNQKGEVADKNSELSRLQAELDKLQALKDGLEEQLTESQNEEAALRKETDELKEKLKLLEASQTVAPLLVSADDNKTQGVDPSEHAQMKKDLENKIQQMEKEHGKEIQAKEKEKRVLEKDIKKLLKQAAKQEKQSKDDKNDANASKLLEVVIQQVHEIHGEVKKAAEQVDSRLKTAEKDQNNVGQEQNKAKNEVKNWEIGWAEENAREPTQADRDEDVKKLYAAMAAADEKLEKNQLLVTALGMMKTGVVPEQMAPVSAPLSRQATTVTHTAAAPPSGISEEEVAKLEAKIEELEDRVMDLEFKKSDLERDNKNLTEAKKHQDEKLKQLEAELAALQAELTAAQQQAQVAAAAAAEAQAALEEKAGWIHPKVHADLKNDLEKQLKDQAEDYEKKLKQKDNEYRLIEKDMKALMREHEKLKKKLKELKGGSDEAAPPADGSTAELEAKIEELEDKLADMGYKKSDLERAKNNLTTANQDLEDKIRQLEEQLSAAEAQAAAAQAQAATAAVVVPVDDKAGWIHPDIHARVKTELENAKEKEKKLEEKLEKLEQQKREILKDMKQLLREHERLKKKWKSHKCGETAPPATEGNVAEMQDKLDKMEDKAAELEDKNTYLTSDLKKMTKKNQEQEEKMKQLEAELAAAQMQAATSTAAAPVAAASVTDADGLSAKITQLQRQVDAAEAKASGERSSHELTKEELEALRRQVMALKEELAKCKASCKTKVDTLTAKNKAETANLNKTLADAQNRVEELEKAHLEKMPVDAAKEIKNMQAKLAAAVKEKDAAVAAKVNLTGQLTEMKGKLDANEKTIKTVKHANDELQAKNTELRSEKDKQLRQVQQQADRKEQQRSAEEKQKISALQKQIKELKAAAAATAAGRPQLPTTAAHVPKAVAASSGAVEKALNDKLQTAKSELSNQKRENAELQTRLKQAEADLKSSKMDSDSSDRNLMKKHEKILKELEKKYEQSQKKCEKQEENVKKQEEQLNDNQKELKAKEEELSKLKKEFVTVSAEAKNSTEMAAKIKHLEKDVKKLHDENKTLSDNFNQERVLRKKYYNMVEDMKGKIRVYCRSRPLSSEEKGRGNQAVVKSPDEYSISVNTSRGMKEFQFDAVFMADTTQEKVFEDTNNLIQSAVDGYNVCIFAYGQTGSGKTYTIIGDREQKSPGLAPRAFKRIFDLINENKSKFSFKVSCYMLELYNDKLIDLFAKPGTSSDDKMEIKKDKKGLVFIQGSEVKAAHNAKELNALFELGSKNRHTASTNMNAESSRSHLVIGIVLESTSKSTGTVMKGKLSLVDLAGSERVAKTGASADQLKEAMSINKSLSALGDVISALSSEQSFIPYRNNKLTMLMQDSLGGNAKTLMFVNISPADYNCDESVVSLTYASRVKLITNDASKNAENKEINRLKSIIAKMKKGDAVEEED